LNANQIDLTRKGASRDVVAQVAKITMAAGANVVGSIVLPDGAILDGINVEVDAAFSGAPTNINFRAGTTADGSGQQLVADTDVKAAGHFRPTIVAGFVSTMNGSTTLYFRLAATGGTSPAGSATVVVKFLPKSR
jgi:hypothetical protein